MSIDIRVDGKLKTNTIQYSVIEDSTPTDPSDTRGGVGQFSFDLDIADAPKNSIGKIANISDGAYGSTTGTITGLSGTEGVVTVTADSRMAQLVVERIAQPYNGTLGGAFRYYLGMVGITTGLVVDEALELRPVVFRGWSGPVWDQLKMMAVAMRVEISLVSDNIVMRALRTRTAEFGRDISRTWNLDSSQMAQSVEIDYYQNRYVIGGLCYPSGGWNEDVQPFVVDAGKTITADIPLDSSLETINQPQMVAWVDRYHESSSVYSVAGNDGLPIPVAQWQAGGGSLTLKINDDRKSLTMTLVGAAETQYSPYRIAMSSGSGDYSSLRIIGTGVFSTVETLTMSTGVTPDQSSSVVGATVDNAYISSKSQAFSLGLWAVARWGYPSYTLKVQTTGINRAGDTGSYAYLTVGEYDAQGNFASVGAYDTFWSGQTVGQFDSQLKALAASDFTNQAFGNIAGSRVPYDGSLHRIRTATVGPADIMYDAEFDVMVSDVDSLWAGKTVGSFDTANTGSTLYDFQLAPLRSA